MKAKTLSIGVGVFLLAPGDGHFWMNIRKNCADYNNHWQIPGGRVEEGETPLQAAIREVKEETGILLEAFHEVEPVFDEVLKKPSGERYRSIQFLARTNHAPQNLEPEKHGPWVLKSWHAAKGCKTFGAVRRMLYRNFGYRLPWHNKHYIQ